TLYFDSLTVNAGNGGFLHCIQMDTSVNAANQVVSVGADIAFDADPKFFACLVRFESSSVPTTLPTAYDVYPLDGRHDGGYYTRSEERRVGKDGGRLRAPAGQLKHGDRVVDGRMDAGARCRGADWS